MAKYSLETKLAAIQKSYTNYLAEFKMGVLHYINEMGASIHE
ncbi:hypothetical protein [Metabacillus fastidiosus]